MNELAEEYPILRSTLNEKQFSTLQKIEEVLEGNSKNRLFFISGEAGTGKTYFFKTIAAMVAYKYKSFCIQCAPTGMAATLMFNGMTVHKATAMPIDFCPGSNYTIDTKRLELKRLAACKILIIDELSALSKDTLEYIEKVLRQVTGINRSFGGKTIILSGDFKQTLPVIENSGEAETIEKCLKKSEHFKEFEKISFT